MLGFSVAGRPLLELQGSRCLRPLTLNQSLCILSQSIPNAQGGGRKLVRHSHPLRNHQAEICLQPCYSTSPGPRTDLFPPPLIQRKQRTEGQPSTPLPGELSSGHSSRMQLSLPGRYHPCYC